MKWYRFWKIKKNGDQKETYKFFYEEDLQYMDEKTLLEYAERWANHGDKGNIYKFGFEECESKIKGSK